MDERGRVLYRAEPARWAWALYILLPLLLLVLPPAGLFVLVLLMGGEALVLLLTALAALLAAVASVAIALYALRRSFTVTTNGIEIRSFLITRRIPWAEIAVIEQNRGYAWDGAVRVRKRDGRSHVGPLTDVRSGVMRRDPQMLPGPDGLYRPTRAAIDAHRRYLAGEFR